MKKFLKRLLHNAKTDLISSVAGTLAGSNDLINGIQNKNTVQILQGVSIIFLGLITKSNTEVLK